MIMNGIKYCNCDKYHYIDIFLCDHQYLVLKQYGLNCCKRHDIIDLLKGDGFVYICENCEQNKCEGIRRSRLEKYINAEIYFQSFMLHKL